MKYLSTTGRRLVLLVMATALGAFSLASIASADDVSNNIDATLDTTKESISLTAGGSTGTVGLYVQERNGDGVNGCNVKNVGSATFSVASSDPAIATVSPASVTFDECSDTPQLTVTPLAEGSTDVTLTLTANNTGATFNTAPATFTVNVAAAAPSDSTPPVIDYTLNPEDPDGSNGWYTSNVTLTWDVSEPDSPGSLVKTGCNDQNITADQQSTEYSCSASSDGGSSGPVTVNIKRDATKPNASVTGVSNGATYTLGSVPTAGCDTSDATSDVATAASLSSSGGPVGSITATCSGAEDNAGNDGDPASATYSVHYAWNGFFRPVDNGGVYNAAKAGSSIPVKFSLDGNQGLNIMAANSPSSGKIPCDASAPIDEVENTVTAGNSSLQYDSVTDTYTYVWKTDKAWAGTCRQLSVALNDGTVHTAKFKLAK